MMNQKIPFQFRENSGIVNDDDYNTIENIKVIIVGLGGIGGHVTNNLIRLGLKHVLLVDYDSFDESNLNRQLFSNTKCIGKKKTEILENEIRKISPECQIQTFELRIQEIPQNALTEYDYIIDAVDDPNTKVYLSELATALDIPILHGACGGWYGQIGWMLPGCNLIKELYRDNTKGLEKELKNPSFTPSLIAALMTSEFLKMIKKSTKTTINELLLVDIFNNILSTTGKERK